MADDLRPFEPTDIAPYMEHLTRITEDHLAEFWFVMDGGDPSEIERIERAYGVEFTWE